MNKNEREKKLRMKNNSKKEGNYFQEIITERKERIESSNTEIGYIELQNRIEINEKEG